MHFLWCQEWSAHTVSIPCQPLRWRFTIHPIVCTVYIQSFGKFECQHGSVSPDSWRALSRPRTYRPFEMSDGWIHREKRCVYTKRPDYGSLYKACNLKIKQYSLSVIKDNLPILEHRPNAILLTNSLVKIEKHYKSIERSLKIQKWGGS